MFRLFGEGKTAKEIAGQLNLSPKTVSVHRDHIKEKLKFATSAEMIHQAGAYVELRGSSAQTSNRCRQSCSGGSCDRRSGEQRRSGIDTHRAPLGTANP